MRSLTLFSVLLVALAVTGPVAAQQIPNPSLCPLASQPALVGAGPAPELAAVAPPAFDQAYMARIYQQHADIAALASFAQGRLVDPSLQQFSAKIVRERNDLNSKIAQWYPRYTGQPMPPVSTARVQQIEDALTNCAAPDFDRQYARTMISLMMQSRDAANLARQRLTNPVVKNQAAIVARVNQNEMAAFQRWLNTGFLTAGAEANYYCWNYGMCGWGYGPGPYWWY